MIDGIDEILENIDKAQNPAKEAFSQFNKLPFNILFSYVLRAKVIGYKNAVDAITQVSVVGRLFNANNFIKRVDDGSYEDYLRSLSFGAKCMLVDDLIFKGEFCGNKTGFLSYIQLIKESIIRDDSNDLKK